MMSRILSFLAISCMLLLIGCDSSDDISCLTVTPVEDYILSGTSFTTDFSPASKTYTVTNTCDDDVLLSVQEDVRWLDVEIAAFGGGGNEAGMLDPDTSVEVVIEVRYGTDNPERLDQLESGTYEAEIDFSDESNTNSVIRDVNLTVNAP